MEGNQKFIFIDNGYNEMKCAMLSTNVFHDFDYFRFPTFLVPHLKDLQPINFNKARFEKKSKTFIEKQLVKNPFGLTKGPVPIHKGKILDLESFEYAW